MKTSARSHSRMLIIAVGGAIIAAVAAGIAQFNGEATSSGTRVWSAEHGHYHDANGVAVP